MKKAMTGLLAIVAVAGAAAVVGCVQKTDPASPKPAGVMERSGAALDRAAEKTVEVATNVAHKTVEVATNVAAKTAEAAKATAVATKDVAGQAVEKTGEVLGNAGTAVEKAGTDMQK